MERKISGKRCHKVILSPNNQERSLEYLNNEAERESEHPKKIKKTYLIIPSTK